MNVGSYGPTERHLGLLTKIPTRTWDDCRTTSTKHVSQPVNGSAMFYLHSRSGMCQMMPSNQRSTKNGSSHPEKRRIARRFTYAVLCCAVIHYKHVAQPVIGSLIFYLWSRSGMCQMMPSNQRSTKNESSHPQKRPIGRWFTCAVLCRAVISHCCVVQCFTKGHSLCVRNAQREAPVRPPDHRCRHSTHTLLPNPPIGQRCLLAAFCNVVVHCDR